MRQAGPALESIYRFVLWLVPAWRSFKSPRWQKFLLGDRAAGLRALVRLSREMEA